MENKAVLNRRDLKELLGVKNLRLKALIGQGLPYIKLNSERGCYVFLKASVIAWLKSLEQNNLPPKDKQEDKPDKKLAMPRG